MLDVEEVSWEPWLQLLLALALPSAKSTSVSVRHFDECPKSGGRAA